MQEMYSIWNAALLLTAELNKRTTKQWWSYLKHNPRKWQEQDGFLINFHLIDGELFYTEAGLKAFINAHKQETNGEVHGRFK